MIKSLDHINIVVTDLEQSKTFFIQLGFTVVTEADLEGDWISDIVGLKNIRGRYLKLSPPIGNTNIELMEYYQPPSDRDPKMAIANQLGLRHLAFEVMNIELTVDQLKQRGVKFISEVTVYPETGKKLIYFYGPDNILLEFAEYPDK